MKLKLLEMGFVGILALMAGRTADADTSQVIQFNTDRLVLHGSLPAGIVVSGFIFYKPVDASSAACQFDADASDINGSTKFSYLETTSDSTGKYSISFALNGIRPNGAKGNCAYEPDEILYELKKGDFQSDMKIARAEDVADMDFFVDLSGKKSIGCQFADPVLATCDLSAGYWSSKFTNANVEMDFVQAKDWWDDN